MSNGWRSIERVILSLLLYLLQRWKDLSSALQKNANSPLWLPKEFLRTMQLKSFLVLQLSWKLLETRKVMLFFFFFCLESSTALVFAHLHFCITENHKTIYFFKYSSIFTCSDRFSWFIAMPCFKFIDYHQPFHNMLCISKHLYKQQRVHFPFWTHLLFMIKERYATRYVFFFALVTEKLRSIHAVLNRWTPSSARVCSFLNP